MSRQSLVESDSGNGGDPNAGTKSQNFYPAGRAALFRGRYDKLPLLCEAELDARGVINSNGDTWLANLFLFIIRDYNADILIDLLNRIPDWQNDPIIAEVVATFLVRAPDNLLYIPEDESEFMPSEELLQYLNLNEEERARMIADYKRLYVELAAFRKTMLDYFDAQGLDVEKAKQRVKQESLRIDKHEKMDPEQKKRMQYYGSLPELDVLPRLPNRTLTGKQGTP